MITVTKLDGTTEPYSEAKIKASASRIGVPNSLQEAILHELRGKLRDGISTREIYTLIRDSLQRSPSPGLSLKFNLKAALSKLGPTGFPFEQYLAELLRAAGYQIRTNVDLAGACVHHEIDLLAARAGTTYFVEAKFHKNLTQRTDLKVTLYIRARYEDLAAAQSNPTQSWLITNTRFTSEAVRYGRCRSLLLTSWDYPAGQGLRELIDHHHLYPITVLDLSPTDLALLFSQNIVTCSKLLASASLPLSPSVRRQALSQASSLCPASSK